MFTRLKSLSLKKYIWLISILPTAGFLFFIGWSYYEFNSHSKFLKNLGNIINGQAQLTSVQQQLITQVTTEQSQSLERMAVILKVATGVEIALIFWSVSGMISGVTSRVEKMAGEMAASAANMRGISRRKRGWRRSRRRR